MPTTGLSYITSKEGIVRAVIIVFGCIAFALVAASGYRFDVVDWVMAAYIISWCFSLLSYFFIATTLASKMECGVSYDVVDVCLSVFSFFQCLIASIVLAIYTGWYSDERIAADVFGFLTTIMYAIEIYFLRGNFPESLKYLTTQPGILKAIICVLGCTTYALLDASGYRCYYPDGCDEARTWVFAAFIYCWAVSVIILMLRVTGVADKIAAASSKIGSFNTIDFIWSVFSSLNYLIAAIVLACYLKCVSFGHYTCDTRLASDIFGFIVAILYLVEAVLLKNKPTEVTPK